MYIKSFLVIVIPNNFNKVVPEASILQQSVIYNIFQSKLKKLARHFCFNLGIVEYLTGGILTIVLNPQ